MDALTPAGRQIILDLLAKSIEKVKDPDAQNKKEKGEPEIRNQKKRKHSHADKMLKKKKVKKETKEKLNIGDNLFVETDKCECKVNTRVKEEYKETETELKIEHSDLKTVPIYIKTDFTEIETDTDIVDKKEGNDENKPPYQPNNESYIVKALRENMAKYSCENNTSRSIEEELKDAKNVDKKNNFKMENIFTNIASESKSDKIKPKVKIGQQRRTTTIAKIKIEPTYSEPETKTLKLDGFDVETETECGKEETKQGEVERITSFKGNKPKTKSSKKVEVIVEAFEGGKSSKGKRVAYHNQKQVTAVKFTPEEDEILLNAMKNGDKINFVQLGKDLKRKDMSIRNRIEKLKTGKTCRERRLYTLVEDIVVLDAVLKHLDEHQSLEMLNLPYSDWKRVGDLIGSHPRHVTLRWVNHLKPWILQHNSGTLNLDIRRMLANYVADNFKDINSIDWPSVAAKKEFAGHTQASLRNVFFTAIFQETKRNLNAFTEDITLDMVADFANKTFATGGRKVRDTILTRQKEVVAYFECYVKKHCIKSF